jgi:hypothetical protein
MIDKYLGVLVAQLDSRINQIQEALGNGAPKDFPEYKSMCGEVKGLLTARLNIKDLLDKLKDPEDD